MIDRLEGIYIKCLSSTLMERKGKEKEDKRKDWKIEQERNERGSWINAEGEMTSQINK